MSKLINPFTNRKVNPSLKNASRMYQENIPVSWQLVIKRFEQEGHTFLYPMHVQNIQ